MPFFEIKQDMLQSQDTGTTMRFFMDTKNNATLQIWYNKDDRIVKFQLACPGHIIDWKVETGFLTGTVDEDETKVGIKGSPTMSLGSALDQSMVKKFSDILSSAIKKQSDLPIGEILSFIYSKIVPE